MPTRLRRWSAAACAAALLAACNDPAGPGGGEPLDALPRPLTAAEQEVVAGSNTFAWGLLREAGRGKAGENVFVSPLSVSMALGMTGNGARGATASQIHTALGFGGMTQDEVNAAYRGLKDLLLGLDPRVEMQVANSVWYRQGYAFEPAFFDALTRYFDAEATTVDFASPAAKEQMNAWVKAETKGRIPTIIEDVDADQVMYLLNAVYFKGAWVNRFDRTRTGEESFRRTGAAPVNVPMMRASDMPVRFAQTARWTAADLPYGNGAFAMTVVVPAEGVTTDALVAELDGAAWDALVGSMRDARVVVHLPRIKLEWKDDLKTGLMALGIRDAFTEGAADFTGMSAAGGRNLILSEVLHKTFLEVNEEGTEAAAATAVGVVPTSLPPGLYADRPFLLVIRERFSGAILFAGRIEDPTKQQ